MKKLIEGGSKTLIKMMIVTIVLSILTIFTKFIQSIPLDWLFEIGQTHEVGTINFPSGYGMYGLNMLYFILAMLVSVGIFISNKKDKKIIGLCVINWLLLITFPLFFKHSTYLNVTHNSYAILSYFLMLFK